MSFADFQHQVSTILQVHQNFDRQLEENGEADIFNIAVVHPKERIDRSLLDEVAEHTGKLYGFVVRHVPGFYLTRAVGLLWGGCMLSDPDENFSVLLLRNAFKKHRRFLNYTRDELLAHELCHSVRQSLCEYSLEEYFAYRTSSSPVRRYLGNCFIRDTDALFFVIPMLFLPAAELLKGFCFPGFPVWIFWLAAMIYPLFLLIRNALSRRIVNRARKALKSCAVRQVEAVLFRSTLEELKQLPAFTGAPEKFRAWAEERAASDLRWQIILARFTGEDELAQEFQLNENTISEKDLTSHENC